MLQALSITKTHGVDLILENVSLEINRRDQIGLIGANGAGKTTLLKILLDELKPDRGQVIREGSLTVGYLAQSGWAGSSRTIREEALAGFPAITALRHDLEAVERRLGGLPGDHPDLAAIVDRQGELEHAYDAAGGYRLETDLQVILGGLGFRRADLDRPASEFSGGWQMRIGLGRLLLQRPDLLLLDEPTNHLDLAAVEWLESYLRDYAGAFLVVSHDRFFLDRVTSRTIELSEGRLSEYAGNYSFAVRERARRRAARESGFVRQQAEIARQQAFIDRFRAKATKATQAKSRERALERIDRIDAPEAARTGPRVRFDHAGRTGRQVVETRELTQVYGGRTVLGPADLVLERGDRLALIGPNGAGKSTLLRLLAAVEAPAAGQIHFGHNVRPLYFRQDEITRLDPAWTAVEAVQRDTHLTEGEARSLLGRFEFTGDDGLKLVGSLSGGERVRVALARLLTRRANLLLLDEPTNHLDIATREALEAALLEFPGTIVVATHDRYLVDRLANRIAEVIAGQVTVFDEDYAGYRRIQAAQAAALRPPRPVVAAGAATTTGRPRDRKSIARAADLRREITAIERQIDELERTERALAERLNNPDLYADHTAAATAIADHERTRAAIHEATTRWEDLMTRAEGG